MTDLATAAQAQALVDMGHSQRHAANILGLDHVTVHDIVRNKVGWNERKNLPVFKQYRTEQKVILEHAMTNLAGQMFVQAEKSVDKLNGYQAVVAGSILIDKVRLLQGESTQNIAHLHSIDASSLDGLCSMLGQSLTQSTPVIPNQTDNSSIKSAE